MYLLVLTYLAWVNVRVGEFVWAIVFALLALLVLPMAMRGVKSNVPEAPPDKK